MLNTEIWSLINVIICQEYFSPLHRQNCTEVWRKGNKDRRACVVILPWPACHSNSQTRVSFIIQKENYYQIVRIYQNIQLDFPQRTWKGHSRNYLYQDLLSSSCCKVYKDCPPICHYNWLPGLKPTMNKFISKQSHNTVSLLLFSPQDKSCSSWQTLISHQKLIRIIKISTIVDLLI